MCAYQPVMNPSRTRNSPLCCCLVVGRYPNGIWGGLFPTWNIQWEWCRFCRNCRFCRFLQTGKTDKNDNLRIYNFLWYLVIFTMSNMLNVWWLNQFYQPSFHCVQCHSKDFRLLHYLRLCKVRGEHIFVAPLQRIKSSQLCGPPISELYNSYSNVQNTDFT